MKRSLATTAVMAAVVLAGCGEREPAEAAMSAEDAAVEVAAAPVADRATPILGAACRHFAGNDIEAVRCRKGP